MIPQAVLGADDVDNACMRPITADNWQGIVQVPIHAKLDLKRDNTKIRNLTMWLIKEKDGYVFEKRSLANFTVSIL